MFNTNKKRAPADPITEAHERYLSDAKTSGRSLATNKNLPKLTDDILELYFAPVRAQYESLLSEQTRTMGRDHGRHAESERQNLKAKEDKLGQRLAEAKEKERALKLERATLSHTNYKSSNKKMLYAVVVILALGEALVTRPALSIFTANSNLVEFLVLIMLTVVFIMVPHGVVITFRATEDSKYKNFIRIVAVAVLLFGLFALANMRGIYLQQIGSTTMSDIKATSTVPMKVWYFVGLNLFFLFSSTLCVYMMGTSAENESQSKAREIDARLEEVQSEIRMYDSEMHDIPDRMYASERQWSQRQSDMENVRSRISSLFMQAVGAFISENMLYRKNEDGRPTCFDQPVIEGVRVELQNPEVLL